MADAARRMAVIVAGESEIGLAMRVTVTPVLPTQK